MWRKRKQPSFTPRLRNAPDRYLFQSEPQGKWPRRGWRKNEGPGVTHDAGALFLFFPDEHHSVRNDARCVRLSLARMLLQPSIASLPHREFSEMRRSGVCAADYVMSSTVHQQEKWRVLPKIKSGIH
jgi:hypothetical protein